MNILVTGANGFVGRALCNYLSEQGMNAYGLVRKAQEDLHVKKPFVIEDILTHSDWEPILRGMDAVIHTIGLAHVKNRPDKDYYDINTEMTKKLALECVKAGVKRFVYISSIAVYGISSSRDVITLSTPLKPVTPYGQSKLLAESFLHSLQEQGVLDVVIVRPPLIYGANAPGNIDCLIKAIKHNIPLPFATLKNLRSMIYVKNLCDALLICTVSTKAPGNDFLVSDAHDISTNTLIRSLAKGINKNPKIFSFPLAVFYYLFKLVKKEKVLEKITGSLQLDISHIQRTLGWKPPFSFEEGLDQTARNAA